MLKHSTTKKNKGIKKVGYKDMSKKIVYYVIHHSYHAGTLHTSKVVNTMVEVLDFLQAYNDYDDVDKEYVIDKITVTKQWYGNQTVRETLDI